MRQTVEGRGGAATRRDSNSLKLLRIRALRRWAAPPGQEPRSVSDPRPRKREAPWGSHVVLSDRFYREATEAPVPLDLRVLRALRSPFEIDIYVWLTWRFFRLRKPVPIPWASLALQFGCGYATPRHFKKRFLGYLKSVIDYYRR